MELFAEILNNLQWLTIVRKKKCIKVNTSEYKNIQKQFFFFHFPDEWKKIKGCKNMVLIGGRGRVTKRKFYLLESDLLILLEKGEMFQESETM